MAHEASRIRLPNAPASCVLFHSHGACLDKQGHVIAGRYDTGELLMTQPEEPGRGKRVAYQIGCCKAARAQGPSGVAALCECIAVHTVDG